jgi:methionyl-tRNA formyltransferase
VTYAGKVTREQGRIDWTQPAIDVSRRIRAFDPMPGAFSVLRGNEVKLFGARIAHDMTGDPGVVLGIDEMGMLVACGTGGVRIAYAHPAGRRRLASLDWAQGRGVSAGDVFEK